MIIEMTNLSNSKTVYDILGKKPIHPFPARMAPGIAFNVISKCKKPLRILDPMSGSGTVLAIACAGKHNAIGIDIDPLAVLISKVWTTPIDPTVLKNKANEVLVKARQLFISIKPCNAYPKNADAKTRQFVEFWFDDRARMQLTSLASAISRIRNEKIRNAMWCAFSRLIITKKSGASLAMDLSHSRPHKVFKRAPVEPFCKFLSAVDHVADNCIYDTLYQPSKTRMYEGDARDIPLENGSIDLVLTSPPYLNAIDYIRCSKFSLVWMGYSIDHMRNIRSTSIGTESGKRSEDDCVKKIIAKMDLQPRLRARDEVILMRYIDDMRRVVSETARVLSDGGQAVYVIGENTIRGTFIQNSLIIKELARIVGLKCTNRHSRELPPNRRYLPPPIHTKHDLLNGRMRHEVVLTLKKVTPPVNLSSD